MEVYLHLLANRCKEVTHSKEIWLEYYLQDFLVNTNVKDTNQWSTANLATVFI